MKLASLSLEKNLRAKRPDPPEKASMYFPLFAVFPLNFPQYYPTCISHGIITVLMP